MCTGPSLLIFNVAQFSGAAQCFWNPGRADTVLNQRSSCGSAGRWLWTRTIGSTIAGEAVDSALFYPLAFYGAGIIPDDKLLLVMVAQFLAKVGVEIVFTPVTYRIVGFLKRAENEDYYDRDTNFSPFALKS